MACECNKWAKLGLTPRELSKKIGVTMSMADFITTSYRIPINADSPQTACKKKNGYACKTGCRCQCVKTTKVAARRNINCTEDDQSDSDACNLSANCGRKRRQEWSDDCLKDKRKRQQKSRDSSCSDTISDSDSEDCDYKPSTTTCKRYKAAPRPMTRCVKMAKKPTNQRKKPVKAKSRKTEKSQEIKECIPLNLRLDFPLNVYLDNKDIRNMNQEVAAHVEYEHRCPDDQRPPDQMSDTCREEDDGEEEEDDDDDCTEEVCSDDSVQSEYGCKSEEKDCCDQRPIAQNSCPMSLWEKFQCFLAYLEGCMSDLVNKC